MNSLVIVALPAKDDYVNKISSEKVAHMTILFLGEDVTKVDNFGKIVDFTKHAADISLTRFGMEVDRREVLGPDEADVLVFAKSKWSGFEAVNQYRSYLLQDNNIRKAYEAATQFPEWVPHLTLGYPETPAKPDTRDYPGIQYVTFDRIAIWFGDYEGIEFPLKAYDWSMDVAMKASEVVERAFSHVSEKPWSDYKESDYTIEQWHAACLIHLHDGAPTSKSQCKLPVKTPNGALNRNGVHAAAAALAGARSPLKASSEQKAKAAGALRRYYSQLGETPPDSLKQSAIGVIGDILEHHGVKGMKWGVRRKATVGPTEVVIRDSRVPGSKRLKVTGGKGHPATKEALDTRTIGQIGRKSGTKALTNKQLEEYNKRLNLEQNFKRLSTQDLSPGKRMALKLLGQTGNQTSQSVANEASSIAVKKAIKLAAVAA